MVYDPVEVVGVAIPLPTPTLRRNSYRRRSHPADVLHLQQEEAIGLFRDQGGAPKNPSAANHNDGAHLGHQTVSAEENPP